MKKFLVVPLMLILLSGLVVAQEIGVSAEVTGKYDIVNYRGYAGDAPDGYRDTLAGTVPVDGKITFKAEDEAAGLEVVFDLSDLFDIGKLQGWTWANDNKAAVWFKPLKSDLLTIKIGAKPSDATLRYDNLNGLPEKFMDDKYRVVVENYISDFGGDPYGLILTSVPIENLFIGLGWKTTLNDANPAGAGFAQDDRWPRLLDNYLGIQVGAGYTIEGIGSARVQFVAPYAFELDRTADNWGYNSLVDAKTPFPLDANGNPKLNSIQGGFKLTALESMGLTFDFVAKIPLGLTVKTAGGDTTYGGASKIGAVAAFTTGDISVNGGVGVALPYVAIKNDAAEVKAEGLAFQVNVAPALKIGDSVTVGADAAVYANEAQAKEDGLLDLGLDAWVKYTIGKGTLKTGLAVLITNLTEPNNTESQMTLRIPLTVTVGF